VFDVHFETLPAEGPGRHQQRAVHGAFRMPEPGIVISREHISNALERKRFGLITERELVHWATILLLNDAYVLDPAMKTSIADWLNDISLNLRRGLTLPVRKCCEADQCLSKPAYETCFSKLSIANALLRLRN